MSTHLVGSLAGVASAVSFGSFAVPIKSPAVVRAKVHPLIFQSYKSLICFLASWLLLLWADFRFTYWGLVAGLIWVHNGVLAIVSIHMAGLGVAQSVWSAVSILVSFAWGKLLFKEPMDNVPLAVTGLVLMLIGMAGLGATASRFGRSSSSESLGPNQAVGLQRLETQSAPMTRLPLSSYSDRDSSSVRDVKSVGIGVDDSRAVDSESQNLMAAGSLRSNQEQDGPGISKTSWLEEHKFSIGTLTAAWVGVAAGSLMICLKLAPPNCKGDQYAMSFGLGVGIDTVIVLFLYFAACRLLKWQPASFQPQVAAGPASLAGLLWTLGNYLSVVAVDALGISIGFPIVQCNLIISNLWALFYYHEIQGREAVYWFMGSTLVIVAGVCLLAVFGL